MDVDEAKIGQWPNAALVPGTHTHAATGEHVVKPDNPAVFRAMADEIDREVAELEAKLAEKQRVCDIQRESFRKMEADLAATRHAALGLWRRMDALRMAGRAPSQGDLDEMAALLAEHGIGAS